MKVAVTYAKDGLCEIYSATDVYFVLRNFPDLRDKVFRPPARATDHLSLRSHRIRKAADGRARRSAGKARRQMGRKADEPKARGRLMPRTNERERMMNEQPDMTLHVAKALQASEQAERGWTWDDCSSIEIDGWMNLARAAIAVLSAPPDAGSGGDALARALSVFERRRRHIPLEVYEAFQELRAAIAARQPVGVEPVSNRLLRLLRERSALPDSVELNYLRDGDGSGPAWWARRRAELTEQGYSFDFETLSGIEYFTLPGLGDELRAALAEYEVDPPAPAAVPVDGASIPAPSVECYSDNDGDTWFDTPDDHELVQGLEVGDVFELDVSHYSVTRQYVVTKVPDGESDDYEVEPVATHPQPAAAKEQPNG